jgi:hypothetical protein
MPLSLALSPQGIGPLYASGNPILAFLLWDPDPAAKYKERQS